MLLRHRALQRIQYFTSKEQYNGTSKDLIKIQTKRAPKSKRGNLKIHHCLGYWTVVAYWTGEFVEQDTLFDLLKRIQEQSTNKLSIDKCSKFTRDECRISLHKLDI